MTEQSIEHKAVRIYGRGEAPPEVAREIEMVRWAESFQRSTMLIVAAVVLKAEGSLDKAASVLEEAGFVTPWGYFPEDHEAHQWDRGDAVPLQKWVEAEAKNIEKAVGTLGFVLAVDGGMLDKMEEEEKEEKLRNLRRIQ